MCGYFGGKNKKRFIRLEVLKNKTNKIEVDEEGNIVIK